MPVRHATAKWDGSLTEGSGVMRFADYEGPFSFSSRFEEGEGTNPEELIGAAFAGCFSMALSADLGDAGHNAESVSTEATVEVRPQPAGGFAITKIHLKTNATVPGIDDAAVSEDRRWNEAELSGGEGAGCCAGQPRGEAELTRYRAGRRRSAIATRFPAGSSKKRIHSSMPGSPNCPVSSRWIITGSPLKTTPRAESSPAAVSMSSTR